MRWIVIVFLCAVAYARHLSDTYKPADLYRIRREIDPEGSFSLEAVKPLSGPDRRPFLDSRIDGRITPAAGAQGGWRYRRDVDELVDLGEEEMPRFRREVVVKPLGGTKDKPVVSIDLTKRVIDTDDGLKADIFGGAKVTSGKTPSPEFGGTIRKDFDNGHVGGFARADKNRLGSFSPSYGIDGSFKTDDGLKTSISAAQKHDPLGTSRSIGADIRKEFDNGHIGGFARADTNPLGSLSPSYGIDGSFKTDSGWRTDLNAAQRHDPWGKSQSIGAGFGKEFDNGYAGINAGASRTPFGGWERNIGGGVTFNF